MMVDISVQVSLYPLRQEDLSQTINQALGIFHDNGLEVSPGIMSTLVKGDDEAVFAALRNAFLRAAEKEQVVMFTTFSNTPP